MAHDRHQRIVRHVSVIVPLRNEEAFVARCLDSIINQIAHRQDIELLCVDGASSDGTRKILDDYAREHDFVRVLDNPAKIVPIGMNLAITQAAGEVIIRLDGHADYADDYIESCLEVLERTGADVVGGYLATDAHEPSATGRAVAAALSSPFGVGGSTFRTGGIEREADAVPFGCFRRDVFDRFGYFDERLARNQDIELYSRIRKGGGKIIISPDIKLTYFSRSTFGGLRDQAFQNGLWNTYTLFIVGGGLRIRHFVPLAFVLALIGGVFGGAIWAPVWWGVAAILALYTFLAAVMALQASARSRASALLIFLSFWQLHIVYGVGSLIGCLKTPFAFLKGGRGGVP